jgi:hypothetical protein
MTDTDMLIRQLIGGDPGAAARIAANSPQPEGTPS